MMYDGRFTMYDVSAVVPLSGTKEDRTQRTRSKQRNTECKAHRAESRARSVEKEIQTTSVFYRIDHCLLIIDYLSRRSFTARSWIDNLSRRSL